MRVAMLKRAAGPHGFYDLGKVYEVGKDTGEAFLADRACVKSSKDVTAKARRDEGDDS